MASDDPAVGETAAELTFDDLRAEDLKLGVAVIQDQNPIHFDPETAESLGYPDLVNLGPMNMSYLVQATLAVAETPRNVRTFRVRFEDTVYVGDTVIARADVADVDPDGADGNALVDLSLTLEKEDGTVAMTGDATVEVP